jgi:hypothetical protein
MHMTQETAPRIRCRLIGEADISALVGLLEQGFPQRSARYWTRALERLAHRDAPAGYPRFGYMLEIDGAPVGVILLIFSHWRERGEARVRCNLSSWYVDPSYRGYASLLIAAAVREKDVTYINVSPAVHSWPAIEAQGFQRYCDGQMLTFPALSPWVAKARARQFDARRDYGSALSREERDILTAHVEHGCLAYVVHERREAYPFVFLPRRIFLGLVPTLQLVYCRDLDGFTRLAGPIGRALTRRGGFSVLVDASQALPGLVGKYFPNRGPKYFKGPERPRLGDLAYSEAVLFGP